ncbi:MAG: SH3 domain-containing protein [Thermomicrobiales bacterium]
MLHPNVKVSFGGESGPEDFEAHWKLDDSSSEFWDAMAELLALGGSVTPKCMGFVAPYVFSEWPEEYDAFEHGVIVGSQVRLRSAPSLDGLIIGALSFDIVQWVPDDKEVPGWVGVETLDGKRGYVADRYVRSPITYRAIFTKTEGRWYLTALVAGD